MRKPFRHLPYGIYQEPDDTHGVRTCCVCGKYIRRELDLDVRHGEIYCAECAEKEEPE